MKTIYKIYELIKNYNKIKNLKWTKIGMFPYLISLIGIIKIIIQHPIYKTLKYILNTIIIFESILFVLYYYDIPFYALFDINYSITNFFEFFHNSYINLLKWIRGKINYLLDEKIIEPIDDSYQAIKINTDKFSDNSNSNNYLWWLGILTVVTISGVVIYYYYPNILEYFKGNNEKPDNSNSRSIFDEYITKYGKNKSKEIIIPDNPNIAYDDTPIINIVETSEATPKASTSNLPTIETASSISTENRPSIGPSPLRKVSNMNIPKDINPEWETSDYDHYFRES